eukprot:scaffold52223_cov30-Tisochrysis_lutea.AAC.6
MYGLQRREAEGVSGRGMSGLGPHVGARLAIGSMPRLAQPFGQPVVRVTKSSLAMPISRSLAKRRALICGCTRSASVIARPHNGNAGHAIDLRVIASTSSMSLTPCSRRTASTSNFCAGWMLRRTMLCIPRWSMPVRVRGMMAKC